MSKTSLWADNYVEKRKTVEEAISMIRAGQRVFIGSSCGEPQCLVRSLSEATSEFTDIEIVRLMTLETAPLTLIANKTHSKKLNIRSFYAGSAKPRSIARNKRFITPMNLSAIPRLFKSRLMPINVALIQVSPPDDFGWMSLGVSVDITEAAAHSANLVIAQVNPRMPRILGHSFIHMDDIDVIVEYEEDIITIGPLPDSETANVIGRMTARLFDDGSTIQLGLGATSQSILLALSQKNDLGVHTQFVTDDIMHLVSQGAINNRKKGFNQGKLVGSSAAGSRMLYEFLHDNPSIEFYPSDYVNDPTIIARHNRMVTVNVAMAMDLTGQVAADALPNNHFSGVTGMLDFMRGAAQSDGGKSILVLSSTNADGKKSRITPMLNDSAVVIPRADVHYVVTEYGAFNLFGKSLQERAVGMISIAHPDFREELFYEAKNMGLIDSRRTLKESQYGVYPAKMEEVRTINNEKVVIRPAKPVDERRIQEHFYTLDKEDVVARFFHARTSFVHDKVEGMFKIDYINDLTLLAVVGEFGFSRVVGIGEYLLDADSNMAEVAFSISTNFQRKGLGHILLNKLAVAAQEHGISGLTAFVAPHNHAMMNLFKTLAFKVKTEVEDRMIVLKTRFDELK